MVTSLNKAEKRYKTAQSLQPVASELTPKKGGRQKRSKVEAGVQQIIDGAAPYAAALLRDIGKARQKVEHSGGILTYAQLAKSAGELDKKPRDILADVLEIANKHGKKTAEKNSFLPGKPKD